MAVYAWLGMNEKSFIFIMHACERFKILDPLCLDYNKEQQIFYS